MLAPASGALPASRPVPNAGRAGPGLPGRRGQAARNVGFLYTHAQNGWPIFVSP